jgi:hypothetical protein
MFLWWFVVTDFFLNIFFDLGVFKECTLESESISVIRCEDTWAHWKVLVSVTNKC